MDIFQCIIICFIIVALTLIAMTYIAFKFEDKKRQMSKEAANDFLLSLFKNEKKKKEKEEK